MKFLFKSQGVNAPCDFFVGVALRAGQCIPTPRRALRDTPRHTEPPTQTMFARGPVVAVGILVWYRSGTLLSIIVTTPALRATPPQRGTLARGGTYPVPLHWRGGGYADGVVRDFKNVHLVPILCHSRVGGNRVYKICIADFRQIKPQHRIILPD